MNYINLTSAAGLILLHICVIMLSIRLFGAVCKKRICITVCILILTGLSICSLFLQNEIISLIQVGFPAAGSLLARVSLREIRLRTILSEYFTLYMLSIILISASVADQVQGTFAERFFELSAFVILFIACIFITRSGLRQRIKYTLRLTPVIIKKTTLAFLACYAFLSFSILNKPFYYDPLWSNSVKIIFVIMMVIMALIIISLVIYSTSNRHFKGLTAHYENQIKAQSEYYTKLSESNFRLRKFRHDFENLHIGISALLKEGKHDEALKMLETQSRELSIIPSKYDTGSGIADALLLDKAQKGQADGTVIEFEGAIPPEAIKPYDLCIILGNPLDNALEACALISGENKVIKVNCSGNCGFLFIEITNPVNKRVEFSGGMPVTTKHDNDYHGIGLFSLELAVSQYSGELKLSCDDHEFRVSIALSLEKNQ